METTKNTTKTGTGEICPTDQPTKLSAEIVKALSGAAAAVCGLAVSSASFAIGTACGIIIVLGVLKAQGK